METINSASPAITTKPRALTWNQSGCWATQVSAEALLWTHSAVPQNSLVLVATMPASRMPTMASPATRPEATSRPRFSTCSLALASCPKRRSDSRLATHLMSPPTKMAEVVVKGRYIPTAMSMGEGEPMRTNATANSMPMTM